MSGMALIWAANVKGLKPAAKIVLIQLADFHNKETGQCNPSVQRLADECEMGRATLFRHMTTLEECGIVTRHARGDGDGGPMCKHITAPQIAALLASNLVTQAQIQAVGLRT